MPGSREPSSGFWNQPNSPCPPSTWSCCGSRDSLKLTVHLRGLSKQPWQYWMTCQRSLGPFVRHVDASTSPRSHLLPVTSCCLPCWGRCPQDGEQCLYPWGNAGNGRMEDKQGMRLCTWRKALLLLQDGLARYPSNICA